MRPQNVRPLKAPVVLSNTFEELKDDERCEGLEKFELLGQLGSLAAQQGHVLVVDRLGRKPVLIFCQVCLTTFKFNSD